MKNFTSNVTNTWGDQGKEWLKQLPVCIDILSKQYGLTHIKPVSHLSYNYVAFAIQHKNKSVVLKISCDKRVIEDEYKALCHFNGIGSINVLESNSSLHALLLEQAIPGNLLKNKYSRKIEDSILHYAGVVKHLASCPLTNSHFIPVSDWCKAIDQMNDPRIEKHLIEKAQELKIFLLSSVEEEYVCHGDLHGENIVSHYDTWLSIDPKGIIGEMAFEAAAFDLISKNDLLDLNSLQEKIIARVSALAHALDIDFNRLLGWFFLRALISAQWFIEDHGSPDAMLQRASLIYPLITKYCHKENIT